MNLLEKIKEEFTGSSSSSSSSGRLQDWYVTVVRGEGIKDEHFYNRSDPYLKVEFGGKHVKTRTIKQERSPAWNETFHFQLKPDQAGDIVLTLMDDDFGFDDHVGKAVVSKVDLPQYGNQEKTIEAPIYKNNQISGLIYLRVKLVDNSMQQQQQSNQSFQSSNIPYQSSNFPQQQTSSQFSSGYQQQPRSYDLNTQQQQYQNQPFQDQQGQNTQQYPGGQFQQQQQHHHHDNVEQRSNDNYYGKQ